MNLLESLNPKQREAVELPAEHALILAGAGSGKTRVLTTRIAWLLANSKAYPSQILAVTFTNKAAREMKARLEAMLGTDISSMWVGTFHAIAHRLLRAHAVEAGLPKAFQIIDQSDQLSLIKRIMKEAGINTDENDPKAVQAAINHSKEHGLRASDLSAGFGKFETMRGVYAAYEGRCRREGLVDFAELLLACVDLLEKNPLLREHYANRFKFILVDEFQDTNALQYRWIKMLSLPTKHTSAVFCVGDDDQSIYAFRGARVGNMADFVNEYQVRHIVKLEQNYRSTSHILNAANAVISHNKDRMGKNLWTSAGKGDPVALYHAGDDREEALSIVQEIMSRRRSGTRYSDCAVLYRNNAQSRIIEQLLTVNAVPYRIYGGLRFFDRQEVKDVMAYLRLLVNPDDVSLQRVINQPPRGIGQTTVARIANRAQESGVGLWQALVTGLAESSDAGLARAADFVHLIETLRKECETLPLEKVVDTVINESGLKDYYSRAQDKDIRTENLSELVSAAAAFCQENDIDSNESAMRVLPGSEMSPLDGFIAQAVLESDSRGDTQTADAVQLMTVHSSKGLEFDTVFLTGLEEGLFPHPAKDNEDALQALDEERRLLYVAMTRARKHLRISWCEQRRLYGDLRRTGASSFLQEIPETETQRIRSRYDALCAVTNSETWRYSPRSSWQNTSRQTPAMRDVAFGFSGTTKEANPWNLSSGDKVKHRKFGTGTVIKLVNAQSINRASAWVQFSCGRKELLLSVAKLEKMD